MEFVAVILLFIFIISSHEAGHAMAARAFGVGIKKFSIGIGPGITIFRAKNFPIVFSPIIVGGYVVLKSKHMPEEDQKNINGICYEDAAYWKRMIILSAGVAMNLISAMIILCLLFTFYQGERVSFLNFSFILRDNLTVWHQIPLTAISVITNEFSNVLAKLCLAIPKIFIQFFEMAINLSPRENVGLIGSIQSGAKAAQTGMPSYLFVTYFISVLVAALNILPLGIFDGGQIAIQTIERVFGNGRIVRVAQKIILVFGIAFLTVLTLQMLCSDAMEIIRAIRSAL